MIGRYLARAGFPAKDLLGRFRRSEWPTATCDARFDLFRPGCGGVTRVQIQNQISVICG
jgi:hypothetical protein